MTTMTTEQPDQVKKPDSSLQTRLKSALILAPVVLFVIWFGGWLFTLMMGAAAAIAVHEWGRMVSRKASYARGLVETAAVLAAIAVMVAHLVGALIPALIFSLALCFVIYAYNYAQEGPRIRLLLAGVIYIVWSIAIMVWLRTVFPNGLFHFMTLLLVVWASDSCAYAAGRLLGGPKLAPRISPKKTWSGFLGSSLGAGLVAALLVAPFAWPHLALGGLGMTAYFVIGFVLAMVGQAGDLIVSLFKRRFDVKDTGALIPGHGGILDRIDALLLVAIVFGGMAFFFGI